MLNFNAVRIFFWEITSLHQITLLLQLLLSKLVTTVIYHLFLESNITHSFLILISLLVFSMIIRNNNLYFDSVFKEEYPNTFTIIILLLFDRRNILSNFVCPVLLQRFYLYPFLLLTLFAWYSEYHSYVHPPK